MRRSPVRAERCTLRAWKGLDRSREEVSETPKRLSHRRSPSGCVRSVSAHLAFRLVFDRAERRRRIGLLVAQLHRREVPLPPPRATSTSGRCFRPEPPVGVQRAAIQAWDTRECLGAPEQQVRVHLRHRAVRPLPLREHPGVAEPRVRAGSVRAPGASAPRWARRSTHLGWRRTTPRYSATPAIACSRTSMPRTGSERWSGATTTAPVRYTCSQNCTLEDLTLTSR